MVWEYAIDGAPEVVTTASYAPGGKYTVSVPVNDGSYTALVITATASNPAGSDAKDITVTVI